MTNKRKLCRTTGSIDVSCAGRRRKRIKILSSKDAKKAYVQCTAAALRAKDSVMKTVTTVQENAGDVLAEAKQINEDRAAEEAEAEVKEEA